MERVRNGGRRRRGEWGEGAGGFGRARLRPGRVRGFCKERDGCAFSYGRDKARPSPAADASPFLLGTLMVEWLKVGADRRAARASAWGD